MATAAWTQAETSSRFTSVTAIGPARKSLTVSGGQVHSDINDTIVGCVDTSAITIDWYVNTVFAYTDYYV